MFTLMIILVLNNGINYTGFATFASETQVGAAISDLTSNTALGLLGDNAKICIVTEMDDLTTYYHNIVNSGILSVQNEYCADPGQDNVIIKFNSYDDLVEAGANPKTFILEKQNTGYYTFPSNYIQTGGSPQCTQSFQQKYCGPFFYYFTKTELSKMDLACCANYELSPEQEATLNLLKGKKPVNLNTITEFLFSTTGVIIAIIGIVFIIVIASLVMIKPKNPLSDYVKNTRAQGYDDEQIKELLRQSGWDDKVISGAFKKK